MLFGIVIQLREPTVTENCLNCFEIGLDLLFVASLTLRSSPLGLLKLPKTFLSMISALSQLSEARL